MALVRPALLELPGGGMSIEYHSRQPMPAAETGHPDCEVLGVSECYHDGITGGTQADFKPWFRALRQSVHCGRVIHRYQATAWTHVSDKPAIRIADRSANSILDACTRQGPCVVPARSLALVAAALDHPALRLPLLPAAR